MRACVSVRSLCAKHRRKRVERGEEMSLSDSRDLLTYVRQRVGPIDLPLLLTADKQNQPLLKCLGKCASGGCFVPALEGCWHIYDMVLLNKPLFSRLAFMLLFYKRSGLALQTI